MRKGYVLMRGSFFYAIGRDKKNGYAMGLWSSHDTDKHVFPSVEGAAEMASKYEGSRVVSVNEIPVRLQDQLKQEENKAMAEKKTSRRKTKEWKVGEKTRAGCEILKVKTVTDGGAHGSIVLTVKCQESGKPFDIKPQDAHQVRLHPDLRKKKRGKKSSPEKVAKGKSTPKAAPAKKVAKKKAA